MLYTYTPAPLSEKLGLILHQVDKLRPLPTSTTRVLNALEKPDVSIRELAGLFALDQALTGLVLQAANSVFLGYSSPCSNLTEAVMRLGFEHMKAVVMQGIAVAPMARQLAGYRLGAGALWDHSLATAKIARQVAKEVTYADCEGAYVAGLLHDIGKLLLDQFVLEDYLEIVRVMQERQIAVWQAEQEMFGIDHARVGGMIAVKWNLPNKLVNAIQYHHVPSPAWAHKELSAIVNIANSFTPKDSTSLSGLDGRLASPVAMEILHLDSYMLDRLWKKVTQAIQSDLSTPDLPEAHHERSRT